MSYTKEPRSIPVIKASSPEDFISSTIEAELNPVTLG
jgi:hypothetical protein